MLQAGGHTSILASTISRCHAWSTGGGLATEMDDENEKDPTKPFDRQTRLTIQGTTFSDNHGTGRHLFVGPYFELSLTNTSEVMGANQSSLNRSSPGVTWRKRICDKGEYVAPSTYCERCVSYKFSVDAWSQNVDCTPAQSSKAYAPGGAVMVALSNYWHSIEEGPVRDCSNCSERTGNLSGVER